MVGPNKRLVITFQRNETTSVGVIQEDRFHQRHRVSRSDLVLEANTFLWHWCWP